MQWYYFTPEFQKTVWEERKVDDAVILARISKRKAGRSSVPARRPAWSLLSAFNLLRMGT